MAQLHQELGHSQNEPSKLSVFTLVIHVINNVSSVMSLTQICYLQQYSCLLQVDPKHMNIRALSFENMLNSLRVQQQDWYYSKNRHKCVIQAFSLYTFANNSYKLPKETQLLHQNKLILC